MQIIAKNIHFGTKYECNSENMAVNESKCETAKRQIQKAASDITYLHKEVFPMLPLNIGGVLIVCKIRSPTSVPEYALVRSLNLPPSAWYDKFYTYSTHLTMQPFTLSSALIQLTIGDFIFRTI